MSEIGMRGLTVGEPLRSEQEQCLGECRWLIEFGRRALQQKWGVVTYRGSIPIDSREEWRDVPDSSA